MPRPKGHRRGCMCVVCNGMRAKRKAKAEARKNNVSYALVTNTATRLEVSQEDLVQAENNLVWTRRVARVGEALSIVSLVLWAGFMATTGNGHGFLTNGIFIHFMTRWLRRQEEKGYQLVLSLRQRTEALADAVVDMDRRLETNKEHPS